MAIFAPLVPSFLILGYLFGLPTLAVPLVILIVMVCFLVLKPKALSALVNQDFEDVASYQNRMPWRLLFAALALVPCFVLIVGIAKFHAGKQGIDFAIFSQVVNSVADGKGLITSLVDSQWHNFLTHHFSPYLFLVGLLAKASQSAEFTLLVLHALTVAAISCVLYKTSIVQGTSRYVALLFVSLCILLPSPRVSFFWEVRDEIFALPFLLLAYRYLFKGKHRSALICLCFSCLFKESMFVAAACFCIMALSYRSNDPSFTARKLYVSFGCLFLLAFAAYSFIMPKFLFTATFNASSRLASPHELLEPALLKQKLHWLLVMAIPLLPLFVVGMKLSWKDRQVSSYLKRLVLLLLPAAPFCGAILATSFTPMLDTTNYYSVVPSILVCLALYLAVPQGKEKEHAMALIFCCILASVCGERMRPIQDIKVWLTKPSPAVELRSMISPDATVIAGDFDASFFVSQTKVIRLYHANRNVIKFDFIVQRKKGPSASVGVPLSKYLRSWSKTCYESETWVVRCSIGKARSLV